MVRRLFVTIAAVVCLASCTIGGDGESEYGTGLLERGTPAPDFAINAGGHPDGLRLSSLRGGYVLIEFWASWCPDCRSVTVEVKDIYDTYSPEGLTLVGVSFDEDAEEWLEYVDANGLAWMQHREEKPWRESAVAAEYNIRWIPTFYLIAPDGTVDFATVDIGELREALESRVNS